MTQGRKYANLPDLDTSQDVFESQTAATDTTSQTEDAPPNSQSSGPESDTDSSEHTSDADQVSRTRRSRVSRHGVSTSRARSQFSSARLDARDIDVSDRITGGRKSYRIPSKRRSRRRKVQGGRYGYVDEHEAGSDSEEETYEERVARLKREIEEVKAESEQKGRHEDEARAPDHDTSLQELSNMINALQTHSRPPRPRGQTATANGAPVPPTAPLLPTTSAPLPPEEITPILNQASILESRLTILENSLGLPAISSIQTSQSPPPRNVLTTLSKLESQLLSLNTTTLPNIESMSSHIQKMTSSANRLREAREAARAAAAQSPNGTSSRNAQTNGDTSEQPDFADDIDLTTRINALHATLPQLLNLSPVLPSLLDRLKSLRVLHADAATVSERFAEAEKLQARMGGELERWRGAVEALEGQVDEIEEGNGANRGIMKGWVGGLEGRLKGLD